MSLYWQTTRFSIDLSQPRIMGIVNITPDSFSDGGQHADRGGALSHCEQLVRDGAHILDLGGESSRPGAPPLPVEEELARVLPILRDALTLGVPVSVDTYKAAVMQAALDLGADIINDIWALRQPGVNGSASAMDVVAQHPNCGVCLMHMHGEPQTMQLQPMSVTGTALRTSGTVEVGVCDEVRSFLEQRSHSLIAQGVDKSRIVWDMGIGFGKTIAQNFSLLQHQAEWLQSGYPILVGWSRKSSLGAVTGLAVEQRMVPSVVAALLAVQQGASVVRVHDVRETVAALQVWQAMIAQA